MKKLITLAIVSAMLLASTACGNMDLIDTNFTFDTAIIGMPDGSAKTVEIKTWRDYEDGEQLQITAKDGTVYLVSANNTVLIHTKGE